MTKYNPNENRKSISLLINVHAKVEALRDELKLNSLADTIDFMANIMREVHLEKFFKCKECDKEINLQPDADLRRKILTHNHLGDQTCPGCIVTSYRVKKDINETTTQSDKNSETTDTSDQEDTKKETEEIEKEWERLGMDYSTWKELKEKGTLI